MSVRLDPRTKLFMLFIVSAVIMMVAVTPMQLALRIVMTLFPIALLILEGRLATAVRFLILYALALFLTFFFLSENSTGVVKSLLTGYCGIVSQFLPSVITAWYVVRTTKIDEFMSAMQKMHVPDGIAISLAVVMRFFPTIKEEYVSIKDAMRMRGVYLGKGNVLKMVEYRLIPLMFSCVNIGDELSAAAITRGLGGNVKRTSVVELKLKAQDYVLMTLFLAITVAFVITKYVKL